MCEASDVSVVAFFLPDLPDSLISNAVSISEALHIPIVTTRSITVRVFRKITFLAEIQTSLDYNTTEQCRGTRPT